MEKFKSLDEQCKEDANVSQYASILNSILETLDIYERRGGPEGIYYTHEGVDGEFLFRNLPKLVAEVITYIRSQYEE